MAGRKLKVFQAQLGFYDTVVAAPSQAAALRAWGIHQNLFANGAAYQTDDPQAVAEARAHPETPLRRAVGTGDAFTLHPENLPKVPDAPVKPGRGPSPRKARPESRPEVFADRSKLDAAEAALRRIDEDRKGEEAKFRLRQNELDAEREAAQGAYIARRKTATASVVVAHEAFKKAGLKN